ncbi:MAG TPA: MBL fold metallo-hydrolase, partial [bacterium]|nr:MBL fold metallo-hydrolase [bacterium]
YVDDFMDDLGITTIHHMILSSPGSDHYSGLRMVAQSSKYSVQNYYENEPWPSGEKTDYDAMITALNTKGAQLWRKVDTGSVLSGAGTDYGPGAWDPDVKFECVYALDVDPSADPEHLTSDNPWSMVLKLSNGSSTFLFGGDAYGNPSYGAYAQEQQIMNDTALRAKIENIGVFKMHHHGSTTSNWQNFVDAMKPKYSVMMDGGSSNFHPYAEILDRLKAAGSIIYRGDLDGTFLIKADDEGNYDVTRTMIYNTDETKNFPWTYLGYQTDDFNNNDDNYESPPLAVPSGLQVVSTTKYSTTLDWNFSTSPLLEGYYLYMSTYPGGDQGANVSGSRFHSGFNPGMTEQTGIYKRYNDIPISSHPYIVTGLAPDTFYYFRLSSLTTHYYERRYSSQISTKTLHLDAVNPGAITDLSARQGADHGEVILSWTSPHEDGSSGGAVTNSIIRYATYSTAGFGGDESAWWDSLLSSFTITDPLSPGEQEERTYFFDAGKTYHAALKSCDEYLNESSLSNIISFLSPDRNGPELLASSPVDGAFDFSSSSRIVLQFGELVDTDTVSSGVTLVEVRNSLNEISGEIAPLSGFERSGNSL